MIDFDFHTHTYPQSDCALQSIEELIQKAHSAGIKILSLTNHDTLDGLYEAKTLCDKFGIEFINGVELTCEIKGESEDLDGTIIHMLGYDLDNDPNLFDSYLTPIKTRNAERALRICEYLRNQGHDVYDCSELRALAAQLAEKNIFTDIKSAKRYLNSDEIDSIFPRHRLSHKQALELIAELNGIAVWAHPLRIWRHEKFSAIELSEVVDIFRTRGLKGLEVFHPDNLKDPDGVQALLTIAKSKDLFVTLGSDTHHLQDKNGYFPLRRELKDFDFDYGQIKYFWKRRGE